MATPQRSLMMEIEIKFGKGRSDRVKVHYDDDADLLADEFVRRHKLKETSKPVIAQYISSTMENFLSQPRRLTKEKRPENHVVPTASESTPLPQTSGEGQSRFSPHPQSTKSEFFPSENVRTPPLPNGSRLSRPSSFLTSTSELGDPAAGVDETDLMSHISRSLSMSMDYKQYQESVDRRMSMKNFSFKDIASEVAVLTKEVSEQGLSVDSDTSTVAAVKPQSTSLYEAPLPDNENTWSTYSGIGYGGGDTRRSSGRYAPLNKEAIDDLSRGNYSSLDNWPDLSPKSRSHLGSRDSTSHFMGDTHSEARDREEMMTVSDMAQEEDSASEVSDGPSAEEMYNRIKMNSNPHTLQPNNGYSSSGWPTSSRVLKPSGSTMQLGMHKSSLSSNQSSANAKTDNKSLVGKSANERLYNAAQLDRDKRSRRAKIASDQEIRSLDEGKFKLNNNSKKMVANLRPRGYQNVHIGERLHIEGVVEKQLKNKRADELQGKLTPEEWSCAKCGTFQKIVMTSAVIQPLHQMQSKAHISNNTSADAAEGKATKQMICKECGWNQSAVQAHRPVNIALMMNEDPDELLRGRWQGNGPVAEEGGIHQYLYENARTRENIQQLNRVLWNEAHSGLTFAPSLPEQSNEILGRYKTTTAGSSAKTVSSLGSSSGFSDGDAVSPPPPAPVGLNKDGKNIIAGSAIGAYLSKSATERLSTTQTRPVLSNIPRHGDNNRNETESQMSTFKHADQSQFVNRLVYEYKDKRERQQKQVEFSSKHDINTGDKLFQPKVGPDPEEALGFGATSVRDKSGGGSKRNVFEDIMLKDQLLKQKRKEAEEKAVAQTMKDLSEKQVKALESSHQILQQSTQSNIEELFQVLLEAQHHIIQDDSALPEGSAEPEWKSFLVDLDVVNTEMMIAEVGLLLNEVRALKLSQLQHAASHNAENTIGGNLADSTNSMLVSFAGFKQLVVKCMKRRDGTGRSYVYVPKKKADVTMEMIQNNLKEETFRPTIDKNSATLSLRRHKELSDYPIEDVLQVEGERIRSKWENARQARILQDSRELTFKPKLFKPPSYVKPKYWGMEGTTQANDSEGEPETDSPQRLQPDVSAELNLTNDSEGQSPALDVSSVVSSDAGQVLQMPALQVRPLPAQTGSKTHTSIPLPSEAFAQAWSGGGYSSQPSVPLDSEREISPVRREHENSPGSKSSDDHSINTISTTFTTEEHLRHASPPGTGGRSVASGVPLVSRRYTSSLSKSSLPTSSSAQNGSVVSSKSNSSITRKAVVVTKPPKANTSGKADPPPALPLFPHELQQRTTPSNSAKHSAWKGGRVSDASELTSSADWLGNSDDHQCIL